MLGGGSGGDLCFRGIAALAVFQNNVDVTPQLVHGNSGVTMDCRGGTLSVSPLASHLNCLQDLKVIVDRYAVDRYACSSLARR